MHLIDDYVDACIMEIQRAGLPLATSVFFGGGTPSLLEGEQLVRILDSLTRTSEAEVTVECNPDTVSPELFAAYKAGGVNRVSLGVQSMVDSVLLTLGREHNVDNVERAVRWADEAGIERINVDLIYGGAGETLEQWRQTVEAVMSLSPRPTHVSAYGLTVEPGTPLAGDADRHPDDDDQADKYVVVDDLLTAAGFENYEISNWAKPGDECRHNLLYWRQGNYRGIGCAAHSHQDGHRWWNLRTPDRYINAVRQNVTTMAADEHLDSRTREFEKFELLLRMKDGIPHERLPMDELEGFVSRRGRNAVLTQKGKLMANEISTRIYLDNSESSESFR